MQRIYAFVIFTIFATFAQAQVNEVPISSNPILEKHFAEKQIRIQNILQELQAERQGVTPRSADPIQVSGKCVQADTEYSFCEDFLSFGDPADLTVVNCSPSQPLQYGSTTTTDSTCIFTANAGVTLGFDSLCVKVCDTLNVCDTILLPIIVHRAPLTHIMPTTVLNAEQSSTVCVDTNVLPGNFLTSQILGNNAQLGEVFRVDDCVYYEANRFAGIDTVNFEICDNYCVCDVYKIPFRIQQDTVGLPFMDDFSYAGPYPIIENWLDKNVFINNAMAVDPVSVGVATFDGLNERGAPYGGNYGSSDHLTSAYIDLSPYNASSNVYLSFYVQPKGLGDDPLQQDSLILEFKDFNDDWNEIASYTLNDLPTDTFTFFAYHINLSPYFFNGFQFRLRNFSKRSGNVDHWHIDYVRLVENSSDNPIFQDIAFTQLPNSILKTYTSMPWWHFEANALSEVPESPNFSDINMYNHFDDTNDVGNPRVKITELETGTSLLNDLVLNGIERNVPVGHYSIIPNTLPAVYNAFTDGMTNSTFDGANFLRFEKQFSFSLSEENPTLYPPVGHNNTVKLTTIFDNYFAYDDGTAETGFEVTDNDVQVAMKFHTNVDDTLKAVQIHFPHIAVDASNQLFNLRVWVGELDDEPEFDGILQKPLYIDSYTDSLNGYATYLIQDFVTGERVPLFIPAGDFYVGWQQVSDCDVFQCIAVGFDRNNPEGQNHIYVDPTGIGVGWKALIDAPGGINLKGSLMIRPVVGPGEPEASANTEDITENPRFKIYPNPTNGILNIEMEDGNYEHFTYLVFNAVGQVVQQSELSNQLYFNNLQNGIYFIKIINEKTQKVFNHKIILSK